MSTTRTTSRWPFVPNGVTTSFPFDNLVLAAADLQAFWLDSNGNPLVLPAFTVAGVGAPTGGNAVFATAPAAVAGSVAWLERITSPVTTGSDQQDFIQESAASRQLYRDKGLLLAQEAANRLIRTLQLSPFEAGPLVLPPKALRANMAMLFDALGNLTIGAPLTPGALVAGAWIIANLLPVNSQAAALTALGAMGLATNDAVPGNKAFAGVVTFVTQMLADNSTKAATTAYVDRAVSSGTSLLRGYLQGLQVQNAGASATVTIGPGTAADSTNTKMMALPAGIAKTTAAWAVGTNQGGLDTGVIAPNTGYHLFEILRTDTGNVDAVISLSPTAPTLTAAGLVPYTLFRRIRSIFTDGASHWVSDRQQGDMVWVAPGAADYNGGAFATTLITCAVPIGVRVQPLLAAILDISGAGNIELSIGPGDGVAVMSPFAGSGTSPTTFTVQRALAPPTNLAGQVYMQLTLSSGAGTATIVTIGWLDRRGQDD